MPIYRLLLILAGAFGILDTLIVSTISNSNLGVLLPGILGAPLLAVGLFQPFFREALPAGWYAAFKWLLLIGYTAALLLFAGTSLLLHREARREAPGNLDAVIVLGAGLRGERPTRILRQRMDAAIAYMEQNAHTIAILSGGQGEGESIPEAEAMARYFEERGLPAQRFIKEGASTSTIENFECSEKIIREQFGADASIGYVTTGFHIYRAGRVAASQGIEAYGIAAPDVWYISLNNYLRECTAVWLYLLRGDITLR